MVMAFISSVFGMMNFASGCLSLPADSLFAIGIIRLLLGMVSFGGALVYLLKGNAAGNINLIFAVCFGLFSGSNLMITVYNRTMEVYLQPTIYGILQLMAFLFVFCLLPAFRKLPFYLWLANFCTAGGLFCFGTSDLFLIPSLTFYGGCFFLVFSLLSMYSGLSFILPSLPQGKTAGQILPFLWPADRKNR